MAGSGLTVVGLFAVDATPWYVQYGTLGLSGVAAYRAASDADSARDAARVVSSGPTPPPSHR